MTIITAPIKASALSGDSTLRFRSTMTKSRSRLRNWKRLGYRNRTANRYEELIGQQECRAHRVRNNELSDLEGFVMSPGQDIPAAIENAVIMPAVSASKIERGSARRIGHQNIGYCPKHSFSFLGAHGSRSHRQASPIPFSKCCCPLLRMANVGRRLDQCPLEIIALELKLGPALGRPP